MKSTTGTKSAATSERAQTDGVPGPTSAALDDDQEGSGTPSLHCKESLLSSSDTDDGDAPGYSKLVIDLGVDAGGGTTPADPHSVTDSKPETTAMSNATPNTTSSRSEASKSRGGGAVDGKSGGASSAPSHRSKPGAAPHGAVELPNGGGGVAHGGGGGKAGLKMKIRCSQPQGAGGQPARHEVSHFHHAGSPPPQPAHPEASSGRIPASSAGSGKSAGSTQEKGRSSSAGGSHRRDRAQLGGGKDRSATSKVPYTLLYEKIN